MNYRYPASLSDLSAHLLKSQLVDILIAPTKEAAAALHKQHLLSRCPQHAERIRAAF